MSITIAELLITVKQHRDMYKVNELGWGGGKKKNNYISNESHQRYTRRII
jgi:hypothetical protein